MYGIIVMKQKNKIPKDWKYESMDNILNNIEYGTSKIYYDKKNIKIVGMKDFSNGKINVNNLDLVNIPERDVTKLLLKKGDVLLNRTNSYDLVGKIAIYDSAERAVFASYLVRLNIKKEIINSYFFNYYFNLKENQLIIKSIATRAVSQANINPTQFRKKCFILYPINLKEQEKIVEILELWDKAIETTKKLIEQKKLQKKYLMQKLLTGKICLKGFKTEWKEVTINDVLLERKIYSEKGKEYPHISLTKEGVVPKTERYERDFLVKDKNKEYKITKLNDICYNPANLKFGVIAKNSYGNGIFSPIYVTYEIKKNVNIDFISYYVVQPFFINKARRVEEGTVYEQMAVNPEDFVKVKIKIPTDLKEQEKIADILLTADKQIDLLKQKLSKLELQKKGLMQKLLTGEIRVC